jgi:hypothetical protein
VIRLGRSKYEALLSEGHDRPLTAREVKFMERYRAHHPECAQYEAMEEEGFALLRGLTLDSDHDAPDHFENRVIRRWRVQSVKETATYWSPAICGAIVAAVALLAMFQLLGRSSTLKPLSVTGSEARRSEPPKPVFPNVRLSGDPNIPQ